jgi:hypothetical protein
MILICKLQDNLRVYEDKRGQFWYGRMHGDVERLEKCDMSDALNDGNKDSLRTQELFKLKNADKLEAGEVRALNAHEQLSADFALLDEQSDVSGIVRLHREHPEVQLGQVPKDMSTATKFDDGKPAMDLVPPRALMVCADVFAFGARKYDRHNWRRGGGMSWGRLLSAALRHLMLFIGGEDIDPDSNLPHLAHSAVNCLMVLEYFLNNEGTDDRFSSK